MNNNFIIFLKGILTLSSYTQLNVLTLNFNYKIYAVYFI
jgi:hypothetical protein